ncbi:hypothetical protein IGI04_007285 [Brassica rapa subsp. trilocularis]|uniref:Uncharacterized protein n=1 Tax=Brassica rapa subsp. trilocularis TaxID=1813537 RepID=A0ABQ7NKJ6_BRACM|nr:hypothetical protein IGI04_007285 [Brassica rapa subsp. trilocularis]
MVLMVTAPPSYIRPPPDPPPLPCKPPPLEACSLIISPEPPDSTAALIRLLAPLHILEPSVSSLVPVVAVTPLSFFAMTKGLTRSVFVSFGVRVSTTCRFQSSPTFQIEPWFLFVETSLCSEGIFSVSSCNKPYMDEYYLVLGISCVKMNHLPLNEDVALSLNILLPLVKDVTSSLPLPQYEDLTLPQYEDVTLFYLLLVPQYEVRIRTFVLSALVSMVAEIDAFRNGGFGWYIHGSCAGLSKLQVFSDSNVFFSALHSGMGLNGIAGCLLDITNLATPLPSLAVAFAMYVFFRLCFTFTLF